VKHEPTNLNENEHILNFNYIMLSKQDAHTILNCVKNAIKIYEDDSENDLLGMDESDLEIGKEFINCFKSIYKNVKKFINKNNEESFNLKINSNEVESLQTAFELYCIDMDKEIINKNHINSLELYDKIKKINYEILNITNPKYIEMLNNFENTSLK
jgi:hypothetical protein